MLSAILDHFCSFFFFSQKASSNQFWRLSVWVMPQHSVRLKVGVFQMLEPFGQIFATVFEVMLFWMTPIRYRSTRILTFSCELKYNPDFAVPSLIARRLCADDLPLQQWMAGRCVQCSCGGQWFSPVSSYTFLLACFSNSGFVNLELSVPANPKLWLLRFW